MRLIKFSIVALTIMLVSFSSKRSDVHVAVRAEKDTITEGSYYNAKIWLENEQLLAKGYSNIRPGYSVPDPNAGQYDWPETIYLDQNRISADTGYITLIAPKIPANGPALMKVKWNAKISVQVSGKDTTFVTPKLYYVKRK